MRYLLVLISVCPRCCICAPRIGTAFAGRTAPGKAIRQAIPSEWKPENFLWRQKLPGVGHSSPVIWDGRLFLTSADSETGEQIIQAFDAISGTPLWETACGRRLLQDPWI